jgi:23S rRNA (cytidine1920-2'-O)/16S rRNA (cytidine1409-2'-O)-methyltransferase
MSKERLDILLVNKGLVESRTLAQKMIMAGDVLVNDQVAYKSSQTFETSVEIRLKQKPRFVSRGGLKLEKALIEFSLENLIGKVCVDVGASTGGFTDCLLQHNAEKVFAVDVGYGQLHQSLRNSLKVIIMEKTNVKNIQSFPEKIDLVTIDVSFISLKTVLPIIKNWVEKSDIQVIALVKPQFEAGRKEAAKGKGVIRNEETRKAILEDVIVYLKKLGINYLGYIESPVLGPKGNKEFLLNLVIPAPK